VPHRHRFPESHSVSFAYIVYAASWLKYHWPTEFFVGLLNAQPMGFYSPNSLVADALHHGVMVRPPDVNRSAHDCTIEPAGTDSDDQKRVMTPAMAMDAGSMASTLEKRMRPKRRPYRKSAKSRASASPPPTRAARLR